MYRSHVNIPMDEVVRKMGLFGLIQWGSVLATTYQFLWQDNEDEYGDASCIVLDVQ